MNITDKYLEIEFILPKRTISDGQGGLKEYQPKFSNGKTNRLIKDLRMLITIDNSGAIQGNTVRGVIYGMNENDMFQVSTFGLRYGQRTASIIVYAGDSRFGKIQIITADLSITNINYNSMPDVSLEFEGVSMYSAKIQTVASNSFKGTQPVAKILEGVAGQVGLSLTNYNVTVSLTDHVISGNPYQIINNVCEAAGIIYSIENGALYIWQKDKPRPIEPIKLSSQTGLISYPEFQELGIVCNSLFNPNILFGREIDVQSAIPQATGVWQAASIRHSLSNEFPQGQWYTSFYGNILGAPYVGKR